MQDDKIDVGEADEIEMEIDLESSTPESTIETEQELDVVVAEEQPAKAEPVQEESEELKTYSEGVNKRIAKLTRKMREAERQKEEAIKYAESVKSQMGARINKMSQDQDKLGANYALRMKDSIVAKLEGAKGKLKEAIDSGDIDLQIQAQRDIAKATMEEAQIAAYDSEVANRAAQPIQQAQPQQAQNFAQMGQEMPKIQEIAQAGRDLDPKAEDWASKNEWFGKDNAMTYTAFDIHTALVDNEGFDPQSPEYYKEVDKRIRVAFPHKFGNVEQSSSAPVQNVAGARRPATSKGRRKTVTLTPSQVSISKRLGVPLEEYAKQLSLKEV
jgi:hypothetical protein